MALLREEIIEKLVGDINLMDRAQKDELCALYGRILLFGASLGTNAGNAALQQLELGVGHTFKHL